MTYRELESAYRQNMFAPEGRKKESLVDLYEALEDKGITGRSGENLYHLAASFFDYLAIEYLVAQDVKPRADDYNSTPLHAAAVSPYSNDRTNYARMEETICRTVKALIDAGVNPKKKNDSDEVAYVKAAMSGMFPFVQAVADAGVKMDAIVKEGKNLLSAICDQLYHRKDVKGEKENAYRTIKILIESGVDPEDKDIFDKDALHYAQRSGVKEIAALLSGEEGDETATKTGGQTLTRAVLNNDIEAVQALLESGADPNTVEEQQRTPLIWACEYLRSEIVKLLLKHQADPNYVVGETGATAIAYLLTASVQHARGSQQELRKLYTGILRAMTDAGLDLNAPLDAEGNTPLIYVANMDYFADMNQTLAEELIDGGANVNAVNRSGQTALMIAAIRGKEQQHGIAELLLDNKADPSPVDAGGNTALMYAAANTDKMSGKKVAELILDAGYSDLSRTNNGGQTATDIAVERENEALVKLLLMNL